MGLPQADGADRSLKAWEPIAASMPLTMLRNGAADVASKANIVIAQALLHIARQGAARLPPNDSD
jgi:hypothetical protein